jgi:predicted HicB family RNase H-like nuclease
MKKASKDQPQAVRIMRLAPDVHEALMIARARTGKSMRQIADEAIRKALGLSIRAA